MEYISAKEFLRQPKEVQKVFIDWYKNQKGWQTDLFDYIGNCDAYKAKFPTVGNNIDFRVLKHGEETLILFTEGCLRKFIEDKGYGIEFNYCDNKEVLYKLYHFEWGYTGKLEDGEKTILETYWKIALEIIKENIKEEI